VYESASVLGALTRINFPYTPDLTGFLKYYCQSTWYCQCAPNLQYLIFDAGFSKVPVQAFEEPQLQSMKRKVIVTEPFPTFLCAAKQ